MKSLFFSFAIILFVFQNIYSQTELVGLYGITKAEKIIFDGDSATALYQTKDKDFAERHRFLDYYIGLPDSLLDLPDGKYILFNTPTDSTLPIIRQLWYIKNNKRDSIWISYNEYGNLQFIKHYKNGQPNGRQVLYDDNGNKIADWHVINNTLNGPAWFYSKYEGVYSEGVFKNGAKTGNWISYVDTLNKSTFYIQEFYSDKKWLRIEKTYRNDSLVEEKYSNKRGYKIYRNGVLAESKKTRKIKIENKKSATKKKQNQESIMLKNIHFDNSLNYIDTSSYMSLLNLVEYLKKDESTIVILSFHTVLSTDNETPQWILDVIRFLINNGINPNRIIAKNYSNHKPLISESNLSRIKNEKRKSRLTRKNQRIEYSIIKK